MLHFISSPHSPTLRKYFRRPPISKKKRLLVNYCNECFSQLLSGTLRFGKFTHRNKRYRSCPLVKIHREYYVFFFKKSVRNKRYRSCPLLLNGTVVVHFPNTLRFSKTENTWIFHSSGGLRFGFPEHSDLENPPCFFGVGIWSPYDETPYGPKSARPP